MIQLLWKKIEVKIGGGELQSASRHKMGIYLERWPYVLIESQTSWE